MSDETLQQFLNRDDPNRVADALRALRMGDVASCGLRMAMGQTVASHRLTLPENAKALIVLAAYGVTGTTTTPFAGVAPGVTPATGEVGIFGDGDIQFAAADAVTVADVVYLSPDADPEEFFLEAASSNAVLPTGPGAVQKKAWILLEAEVITGVIAGTKTIGQRGTAAASGAARIADDGKTINFHSDDVVAGRVRVKALVQRPTLTSRLAATSGF